MISSGANRRQPSNDYKILIFDFDGTLAETLEDVAWCMGKVFQRFGESRPSETAIRTSLGLPLETAIQTLCDKPLSGTELSAWVNFYRATYNSGGAQKTQLYEGIKDLLGQAVENGIVTVVVSNKGLAAISAALERLEIQQLITMTFAADNTAYRKPDARLYTIVIKPFFPDIQDHHVLVIGDTEVDIRFAQNAGLSCCWAAYGYGNREECACLRPNMIVESVSDLRSVIRK